uniref:Uncharacterized protein n=1 Tax=Panagrolaimus sp. PS1159 TaxID=55785 RepID=A0AC35GBA5_9BILA
MVYRHLGLDRNYGRDKNYFWEFICDGSFPTYGTYIEFTEIPCSCISDPIPCTENSYYGIMGPGNGRYCGSLECNITVRMPFMTYKNLNS